MLTACARHRLLRSAPLSSFAPAIAIHLSRVLLIALRAHTAQRAPSVCRHRRMRECLDTVRLDSRLEQHKEQHLPPPIRSNLSKPRCPSPPSSPPPLPSVQARPVDPLPSPLPVPVRGSAVTALPSRTSSLTHSPHPLHTTHPRMHPQPLRPPSHSHHALQHT